MPTNPTNLLITESTHPERVAALRVEVEDAANPGPVLAQDTHTFDQPLPVPMVFPLAFAKAAVPQRPVTLQLFVIEISPDNLEGPRTAVPQTILLEDVPDGADTFAFD